MSKSITNPTTFAVRVVFDPKQVAKAIGADNTDDVIRLGRQVVIATNAADALDLALGEIRRISGNRGLTLLGRVETLGDYQIARDPAPLTDKQQAKVEAQRAKRNAEQGGKRTAKPIPKAERLAKGKANAKRHEADEAAVLPPPVGDVARAA